MNKMLKKLAEAILKNGGSLDVDGGVYLELQVVKYDENEDTTEVVNQMSEEEIINLIEEINDLSGTTIKI